MSMQDNSPAIFVNSSTAHRIARVCAFCSKQGLPFWVREHKQRGQLLGYVVIQDGVVMTNDEVDPYLGHNY
jgi:hypothetical protein